TFVSNSFVCSECILGVGPIIFALPYPLPLSQQRDEAVLDDFSALLGCLLIRWALGHKKGEKPCPQSAHAKIIGHVRYGRPSRRDASH
ncbi:MAG: hypothetical protein M1608_02445, partial [Candidatus Omnitrophica bacterium]|nr:hypothetical protein [Candidatus Omnitrophota bacterium]